MNRYLSLPENAKTPLSSAEADILLATGAKALARSEKDLTHLLERLPVTLKSNREAVIGLSRQLDAARRNQQLGRASTLSPRDAVRFLSTADMDALLASRLEQYTAPLQTVIDALQAELQVARAKLARAGNE